MANVQSWFVKQSMHSSSTTKNTFDVVQLNTCSMQYDSDTSHVIEEQVLCKCAGYVIAQCFPKYPKL